MTDRPEENRPQQSWRPTSFSLRTGLIAITVFAVWLGLHFHGGRRQLAAVNAVLQHGGSTQYDYAFSDGMKFDSYAESAVPSWLLGMLGPDHFHSIVSVSLGTDEGTQRGVHEHEVFRHLQRLPRLSGLSIRGKQPATDDDLRQVIKLTGLRRLLLYDANVTNEGVALLTALPGLEYLLISNAGLSDESLRTLARMPKLQVLALQGNRFTDRGLGHLQNMTQLRRLVVGLGDCEITDAGLAYVSRLKQLEILDLQRCQVTEDGLRHLVGLKNLEHLWLSQSRVEDASWLQMRLPNCRISLGKR